MPPRTALQIVQLPIDKFVRVNDSLPMQSLTEFLVEQEKRTQFAKLLRAVQQMADELDIRVAIEIQDTAPPAVGGNVKGNGDTTSKGSGAALAYGILKESGKPMHKRDLHAAIAKTGFGISLQTLTSYLSRGQTKGKHRFVNAGHGVWTIAKE